MGKKKKYVLKESELREIIQEMVLMELYNPDDYKGMYTQNYPGKVPNVGDAANGLWKLISGIPNAIIPDSVKNAVANGNSDALQWILDVLGAQKEGTAGPDFVKNWWNSKWLGGTGAGVDYGENADAHQQLNVNAACQYIKQIAGPKPGRWCARHVRMALNRGGLGLPHGKLAPRAKDYLTILPGNGWDEIPANQAGEPCDVLVVGPCVDSRGGKHPSGHMAMCIGGGVWVSDYVQRTWHGLVGEPPVGTYHFYRYRNRV